ncbi:mannose-6-phosphate isomerase [Evansella vedderi]|uniref:Mannose-6-phosphate isomerase n=1 Tax=Evansella vedderi TaxID=38282 RepID=A0ABT9ZRA0_9BACI|nr:mannose-6-phosphate isomerase, class I [Evansella vedderi]MDQ0252983.1 mannose-6-phosphate isomerase [Evansella vedderi]
MSKEILFLEPVFKERIWGGDLLAKSFGYDIPSAKTGECWAISAHEHGQSIVKNGSYKGIALGDLWHNHRELFGKAEGDKFPILTKILDATADLSVQVHPDDAYANKYENGEFGKTECWYIIDCKEDAELILGHHAKTREELESMLKNGEWDAFIRKINIKPGDFIFVPSGTVHAICEGTMILETQQSSDVTYRIYDYDRTDDTGNKRELHLDKSIDVITVPHEDVALQFETEKYGDLAVKNLVSTEFFTVEEWVIEGKGTKEHGENFLLFSVIEGEATLNNQVIKKGDHFMLPSGYGEMEVDGKAKLVVSYV